LIYGDEKLDIRRIVKFDQNSVVERLKWVKGSGSVRWQLQLGVGCGKLCGDGTRLEIVDWMERRGVSEEG
jgi:hypothetical protein